MLNARRVENVDDVRASPISVKHVDNDLDEQGMHLTTGEYSNVGWDCFRII